MTKQLLDDLYLQPVKASSLGGVDRLFREARKHLPTLSRSEVVEYLQSKEAYPRHKPVLRRFKRRKVISTDQLDLWQADLADMQKFSKYNDGYKYILTIVDTFTRYGMGILIKTKNPKEIVEGLCTAFKHYGIPTKLQTDNGGEFKNGIVKSFLKDLGVIFYTTRNDDIKCAFAERFNRTIKERLWVYMTEQNEFRYVDVLPDVIKSYNESVHSSTGYAPARMNSPECDEHRARILAAGEPIGSKRPNFAVGDYVRISKKKLTFEKGYETNFTDEIFIIQKSKKLSGNIIVYTIKDRSNNEVKGEFYEQELSKVIVDENPPFHRIERVLRTRKRKGKEEYLIRWAGFPAAFDSWEPVDNLNHVPDFTV